MSLPKPIKVGDKYERVTLMEEVEPHRQENGRLRRVVKVSCDCGKIFTTMLENVYAGYTRSCGCLAVKHGLSRSDFKVVHTNMKARCDNIQHPSYSDYGGRGISYQQSWKKLKAFIDDMFEGYVKGLTLDRIDVNGDYTKDNCRWVDYGVQGHNKRKMSGCLFKQKGVSLNLNGLRYVTSINGKYIATFDTLEDASEAYDNASEVLYNDRPNGTTSKSSYILDIVNSKLERLNLTAKT